MLIVKRSPENPILTPYKGNRWEAEAAFNPSVVKKGKAVHIVYRAVSARQKKSGVELEFSSIGHAVSRDGVHVTERMQLIKPEKEWEKFGCEDPRVTGFEGKYFIFYTALSKFPFSANGIKIGLAITEDFKRLEKHPVTPFNAKAMALFPERINGKIAALLTVHTDAPPAKICLALFDKVEDIWSPAYWHAWYATLDSHVVEIERNENDHIEFGTPPLKTKNGWLIFYSYIYNYFSPPPIFGVQAALLDLKNPRKVVGEVKRPFLVPEEEYELYGKVPNIVFPSGALLTKRSVSLYYGAADTTSCLVTFPLKILLEQLIFVKRRQLIRFEGNPILEPIRDHDWESKAVFNPGAFHEKGKVHLLYRALSEDNTSVIGYAASGDGLHIRERLPMPVYIPRESFEKKVTPSGNSGCEDPRLTKLGGTIYMCYTAFDGKGPPRVALTSIAVKDFLSKKWNWARPILISPPGADDKDTALFPKKIKGKYVFLHRLGINIWIDYVDDLTFKNEKYLGGKVLISPRETAWDSKRIGIAGPPIETKKGWLLLYHGISRRSAHYSVRAALLDLKNPEKVLYRTHDPILEPKMNYEKEGIVPNVVFPCGTAVIGKELYVYYGAADKVIGVAHIPLKELLNSLLEEAKFNRK